MKKNFGKIFYMQVAMTLTTMCSHNCGQCPIVTQPHPVTSVRSRTTSLAGSFMDYGPATLTDHGLPTVMMATNSTMRRLALYG